MESTLKRIGIVDLGSNTARLVVYACEPGSWYRLVDQIREPVRLAEGLAKSGSLSVAAVDRAMTALQLYADFARDTHLGDLTVVATSASRDADNGKEFLEQLRALGLEVTVLDGEQEAAYGVLAVANSFDLADAWVVDLGGGSAQVSLMEGRKFASGKAYPLGAVRLTELFIESDPPARKEIKKVRAQVREHAGDVIDAIRDRHLPLVAIGGTARNLARVVQRGKGYPLSQLHGYFLEREEIETLVDRLVSRTRKRRARIPGIKTDRADIIVAGAIVFQTLLREVDMPGMYVSGQGLREGVFFSHFLPEPHLVPTVRGFGVRNLFQQYPQPVEHTERVRFLARRFFDELKPLHGYGWEEARILDDAAQLHDIGMAVGYHSHHRHGAFLVDTALMPGMSHRDLALLTLLVRYHRKGSPKRGPMRAVLSEDDEALLLRLTVCLRLAEYLERARVGRIKDIDVEIGKKRVKVELVAEEYPGIELYEVNKQADLFEMAFGRKLEVESSIPAPA